MRLTCITAALLGAKILGGVWLGDALVGCTKSASPPATEQQDPSWERTGFNDLKPLSREQLPQRTREPPDLANDQFERFSVCVVYGEIFVDEEGEESVPEVQVVETYLSEYLRRSGCRVVVNESDAQYVLNGRIEVEFDQVLKIRGEAVAYKVLGSSEVSLTDHTGKELVVFEIPEIPQQSVESVESAFLEIRRLAAKLNWERLRDHELFGDPEIAALLLRLLDVDVSQEETDSMPATTRGIIQRLANRGLETVPFMLEALSDTRVVQTASSYPGLTEENTEQLRVYHIADKVLEEIFQKVSRMGLETTDRSRFLIIQGWEGLWKRYCPPYRGENAETAALK